MTKHNMKLFVIGQSELGFKLDNFLVSCPLRAFFGVLPNTEP
jgi:hypothetical protein